ncbi:MAG: 16S rRNA (guanine(527)-N(7))-methyltransferase RsmG [Treponema sp.]|nr:16S rRNA (guanine(527)-N(7))-methyltransferase RsmG [Treponema sp.]
MTTTTENLLEEGLAKIGIGENVMKRTVELLARYIEELELFNPAYGLVKVRDRRELIVKHILDSLAPLSMLRTLHPQPRIADVGSGAGLPGIPLAVCLGGAQFTLIERMGRRAGFLRNVLAVLGLANVEVAEAEMETISPAGCFDIAVFRAFRPLDPAIFKGLARLLTPGGVLAAYKGRLDSVQEEMSALLAALDKTTHTCIGSWEAVPLEPPFAEEQRCLLTIRLVP